MSARYCGASCAIPERRPIRSIWLSLLAGVLVGGCGSEKLPPLNNSDTILAFGDSLTYGVGSANGQTYPAALAELTGLTVVNAGISGETTSQGVRRFQSLLNRHAPQLVVLLEGGNDILRNHTAVKTKQNLARMIEMAQAQNVTVILVGVPEKRLFSDSASLYEELAEEYDLVFADELLADLLRSTRYKSDLIHLNSAGYRKLAQGIAQQLRDNGAIN